MNYKLKRTLVAIAVSLAVCVLSQSARAQSVPGISVADQLKAQYKITKLGQDSSGTSIVEAGTILVVQKGGILGVPQATALILPTATYKDGDLHSPGAAARVFLGNDTRLFQIGEKVYILKLDVNVKAERVSLQILEGPYLSQVAFQFQKGYLETGNIPDIEDTISKVFTIDDGAAQGQPQVAEGAPQVQPANQQPQPDPQTIQLGQTPEQVQTALGKPETVASVGSKQIYKYKDLKVTFVNGKVTDVQ